MEPQLVALAGAGLLIVGFGIGVWLGGSIVARHLLSEVVSQGFLNFQGVRYRVDRIGRKPKGE